VLLGDKAVARVLGEESISESLAEEIHQSNRYPEGTGVRFEVRDVGDIGPPVLLISGKLAA